MCAPLATVAAVAAVASAVVGAGSALYMGKAQANQANYEAQVANQNKTYAEQQAQDAQQRGDIAAQNQYRRLSVLKGQQQAAMAANGIDTNFGSALQVQEDTASVGATDVGTIYHNTFNESKGYEINAANYADQAAADKIKAKTAITGSYFGAASSLLGGAEQFGKIKAKMGTGG